MRTRRMEAIERIANAHVGLPPEPDELKLLVDEAASTVRSLPGTAPILFSVAPVA